MDARSERAMFRHSVIVLLVLLGFVSSGTPAQTPQTKGKDEAVALPLQFRKTRWGMSREQLKKTESKNPVENKSDRVSYNVTVAGIKCLLVYSLVEDKLVSADYIFTQEHSNPDDYIDDFKGIEEAMSEKYGKPSTDGPVWRDDPFDVKDHPEYWGMAIAEGYLEYVATWETPLTRISLLLSGDNYKSTLGAHYESKQFAHLQKQNEAEKARDQF